MADYAPGMRVIIRDEEWMIKKSDKNSYGNSTLQCIGITPLVKDKTAYFLSDLEKIEVVDPAQTKIVPDDSAHFDRSRLYLESQWRQIVPTDTKLHIGHKAVMNVLRYQLEPAQSSLKRPKQRILIADAVGLGKTLEAGILMSELIARGKGQRILVVTVKSMMAQFQKEMWERFTIPLISLDSSRIQAIRREMPVNHNPFHYYDKTIVSVDTIKRDIEYRTHLENARWDIIVIDEAHNVARRGEHVAQRAKLASLLSTRSDTLIMLSATPHDGSAKSFASLMNMLDPTAIPDPDNYTEQDIKDSGDDIKGLFVRRFKKDIQDQTGGKFMERHVSKEECDASLMEETAINDFAELEKRLIGDSGSQLKTMVLKKALFSSPAACIVSVKNRLKRLQDDLSEEAHREKTALEELLTSLERIRPEDFSRYVRLKELLKDRAYAWDSKNKDDRLVIFTERIETMRWLKEHLQQDLSLPEKAIQDLHGGMSDLEQQRIVEEFGRSESPIRILVASDVASEGLNLHYRSHRMIHFDIPWSLMVFQQRNGRIDRYGQEKEPDIRYMVIRTKNEKIRGDIRILEVLIRKEEQANKNIGDPALLMHVYDTEAEEKITAEAMQKGDADAFDQLLAVDEDVDIFSLLDTDDGTQTPVEKENTVEIAEDRTMMSDLEYLQETMKYLSQTKAYDVTPLTQTTGLEIAVTEEMRRRWRHVLPSEAIPEDGYLRLSPDRDFCARENTRSLQNALSEKAWPSVHYLWKQHPIMQWANDKAGQFFGRQEAPLITLQQGLDADEQLFVISSMIPNRRGTPLVDEWFVMRFVGDQFDRLLTMAEFMDRTHFDQRTMPNQGRRQEEDQKRAEALLPEVIRRAITVTNKKYEAYKEFSGNLYYPELEKLDRLREKHHDHIKEKYEQLSFAGKERRREQEERHIEEMFREFYTWVEDSMEIQNHPYIRVIAVFQGVRA